MMYSDDILTASYNEVIRLMKSIGMNNVSIDFEKLDPETQNSIRIELEKVLKQRYNSLSSMLGVQEEFFH